MVQQTPPLPRSAPVSAGFLVLPGFASAEEVATLKARGEELLDAFDPAAISSIFSTRNQEKKTDKYFLDSASNVSFFFEEKAFDADGNLAKPKQLSINKIGHGARGGGAAREGC